MYSSKGKGSFVMVNDSHMFTETRYEHLRHSDQASCLSMRINCTMSYVQEVSTYHTYGRLLKLFGYFY